MTDAVAVDTEVMYYGTVSYYRGEKFKVTSWSRGSLSSSDSYSYDLERVDGSDSLNAVRRQSFFVPRVDRVTCDGWDDHHPYAMGVCVNPVRYVEPTPEPTPEPERLFSVGDFVVVDSDHVNRNVAGKVGTIEEDVSEWGSPVFQVYFPGWGYGHHRDSSCWNINADKLTKASIDVGDTVEGIPGYGTSEADRRRGVVVPSSYDPNENTLLVKFPGWEGGHNGETSDETDRSHWFTTRDDVTLISKGTTNTEENTMTAPTTLHGFNVGDEVRARAGYSGVYRSGKILYIKPGDDSATSETLLVEFPGWTGGHEGYVSGVRFPASGDQSRFWVSPASTQKVSAAPTTPDSDEMKTFKARVYTRAKEVGRREGWCHVVDDLLAELGIDPPEPEKPKLEDGLYHEPGDKSWHFVKDGAVVRHVDSGGEATSGVSEDIFTDYLSRGQIKKVETPA